MARKRINTDEQKKKKDKKDKKKKDAEKLKALRALRIKRERRGKKQKNPPVSSILDTVEQNHELLFVPKIPLRKVPV